MTQLTSGIAIYNSPEDDTQTEFLNFLTSAQTSIHIADYSFNMMEAVTILVEKMKAGLEVKLVLDKSQSVGKTEVPEVKALQAAGVPTVIVESSLHEIMHNKFALVDGHLTLDGSWNFTTAASKENNNFFVFDDNDLTFRVTPVYEKVFQDMWAGRTTIIESKI